MSSLILSVATRILMPLLLVFSVFLLVRGHNEPGGGFVGGLVAASAFALYMIAFGVGAARALLVFDPQRVIAVGLAIALGSGLVGVLYGRPFLSGVWFDFALPFIGKVGTPLLFDIGVYIVVVGVVLMIIFPLADEVRD